MSGTGRRPRHHRQNRTGTTTGRSAGSNTTARIQAAAGASAAAASSGSGTVGRRTQQASVASQNRKQKELQLKQRSEKKGGGAGGSTRSKPRKSEVELEEISPAASAAGNAQALKDLGVSSSSLRGNSKDKGSVKRGTKQSNLADGGGKKKLPTPPTPPHAKGKAVSAEGAMPDFAYQPRERQSESNESGGAGNFLAKLFLYDEDMEEAMVSSYELLDNDVFFTSYDSGVPVIAGRSDDPEFMGQFGGAKKNLTKEEKKEARRTLKNLAAAEMAAIAAAAAAGLDEDDEVKEAAKARLRVKTIGSKRPWFIIIISIIDILLFLLTLYLNNGIEPMTVNPMIGPSAKVLVDMGAKFNPLIRAGEFWRFATPMFLHVGVIHICMNLMFQWAVGKELECFYGPWPIIKIYLVSGVGGNIMSSIFLPHQISVGASSSLYGFYGVKIVDLVQNWTRIKHPLRVTADLAFNIILSLIMGMLPAIDNFAHVGGMLTGMIAAVVWLPKLGKSKGLSAKFKRITAVVAFIGLIALLGIGLLIFYSSESFDCPECEYINCINLPGLQWCNYSDNLFE